MIKFKFIKNLRKGSYNLNLASFAKVLDEAIEKKNKGNEFFQQGNFEKAAEFYTAAIDACPKTDRQELPKFFQNRAAAYENMVTN